MAKYVRYLIVAVILDLIFTFIIIAIATAMSGGDFWSQTRTMFWPLFGILFIPSLILIPIGHSYAME